MVRSLGIVVYFFMAQIGSCICVFTYKSLTDCDWLVRIYDATNIGGVLNVEYIGLLNEVLYPALLISDVIIILPFIIKKKEPICRKISKGKAFYYICLGVVLNFVVSVIVEALPTENYDSLMAVVLTGSFFMVFIVSGCLAPIVEEIIFRYKIITILENKYNSKVALIVSSLLFGLAHMNLVQSTYAFILGLILGRIYQKGRNILPNIIVHLTINAGSVLYEYGSDAVRLICLIGVLIFCFFLLKGVRMSCCNSKI